MKLRDYQIRIKEKVLQEFNQRDSVLVSSPTGSGKTIMGMSIIEEVLRANPDFRVGWTSIRKYHLEQAERARLNYGLTREISYISMFQKKIPQVDLLIVDEAHHDACSTMWNLHQEAKAKKILGLTATPSRSDKAVLAFQSFVQDSSIHQLIQEGWLSTFRLYQIPSFTPEAVALTYIHHAELFGKTVMYFHTMEQCKTCLDLLAASGVKAIIVNQNSDDEKAIQALKKGEVKVLINMNKLTEGFDYDDLDTVFIRPSCKSFTIQAGGRVLRVSPNSKVKNIVQCLNTETPFTLIADPQERFVQQGSSSWVSTQCHKNLWQTEIIKNTEHILAAKTAKIASFASKISFSRLNGNTKVQKVTKEKNHD